MCVLLLVCPGREAWTQAGRLMLGQTACWVEQLSGEGKRKSVKWKTGHWVVTHGWAGVGLGKGCGERGSSCMVSDNYSYRTRCGQCRYLPLAQSLPERRFAWLLGSVPILQASEPSVKLQPCLMDQVLQFHEKEQPQPGPSQSCAGS